MLLHPRAEKIGPDSPNHHEKVSLLCLEQNTEKLRLLVFPAEGIPAKGFFRENVSDTLPRNSQRHPPGTAIPCPGAVPAHPSPGSGAAPAPAASPRLGIRRGCASTPLTRPKPPGEGAEVMLGSARCYATPCGNHGNAQQPGTALFWDRNRDLGSWGLLQPPSPNVSPCPTGLFCT